jgi:hypothetical protein
MHACTYACVHALEYMLLGLPLITWCSGLGQSASPELALVDASVHTCRATGVELQGWTLSYRGVTYMRAICGGTGMCLRLPVLPSLDTSLLVVVASFVFLLSSGIPRWSDPAWCHGWNLQPHGATLPTQGHRKVPRRK